MAAKNAWEDDQSRQGRCVLRTASCDGRPLACRRRSRPGKRPDDLELRRLRRTEAIHDGRRGFGVGEVVEVRYPAATVEHKERLRLAWRAAIHRTCLHDEVVV